MKIKLDKKLNLLLLLILYSCLLAGQTPTIYNVGGSGSYCEGSGGVSIGLDNSDSDTEYWLVKNGSVISSSLVTGTDSPLTWNGNEEGTYEILASRLPSGPSEFMNGEAVIVEYPSPVVTLGFSYMKTLTIDNTKVRGFANLVNFPLLVDIRNDNDLKVLASGGKVRNDNGYDIAFTDDAGNPLFFERISFDGNLGNYSAWVQVPLLRHNSDTEIHIIYGKSGITGDLSSPDLWSSEYIQVNHLDEAASIPDETGNGNYGYYNMPVTGPGKINNAIVFDGDDIISVKEHSTLDGTNDEATISLWINWDNAANGDHQLIMSTENRYGVPTAGFEWAVQATGAHFFYPNGGENLNYNMAPNPFTNGNWHYIAVSMNFGSKEVNMYVDGSELIYSEENVPANWTALADLDNWLWGGNSDRPGRYFEGSMDEIRVQTVARSAWWIETEWENQDDPSDFYSISPESALNAFQDMCENDSPLSLSNALPAGGSYSGLGVVANSFDPTIAGAGTHPITYSYTDARTCSAEGSADILINPTPNPLIIGANSLCFDVVESYTSPLNAGNSYLWTLTASDASINNGQGTNEIEIQWGSNPGSITLMETVDLTGCSETTPEFSVAIVPCQDLVIPEGFSPNNDGVNDFFEITGIEGYENNSLKIYNIHGTEIYSKEGYNNGWDGIANKSQSAGKTVPAGTYYYILKLNGNAKPLKGFVYLNRD